MSTDISRCILIKNQHKIVTEQYNINYGKLWSRDQTNCLNGSIIQTYQKTLQSKKDYLFKNNNNNNNNKLTKKQHYANLANGKKKYFCN